MSEKSASDEKVLAFPKDRASAPALPVSSAKDWDSEAMLSHVQNLVRTGHQPADKALVIAIDCEGGRFHPVWYQSGMSAHEMVTALEMIKQRVIEQL